MPPTCDWDNVEDIATELPGFTGDPQKSNESKLEAIQTAWHEEWEDRKA
jgi:FeS assembly protein IscX